MIYVVYVFAKSRISVAFSSVSSFGIS